MKSRGSSLYIRNVIFGVEDSLVSTVGFLSGIAVAEVDPQTILLAGVVLIVVEGVSMAAGAFLSEASAEEYDAHGAPIKKPHALLAGTTMLGSYFTAGLVPLTPYLIFPIAVALPASIACSVIALVILGAVSGHLSRVNVVRSALRMMSIGGAAIGIGILVASFFGVS